MTSIRNRLFRSLLGTLFLLFLVAAAGHYLYVRKVLIRSFDDTLKAKTVSFSKMIEVEMADGKVEVTLEVSEFPIPEFEVSPDAEYYQVWRKDGSVFSKSRSLREDHLPLLEGRPGRPRVQDIRLPDGRLGRAAAVWQSPTPTGESELGDYDTHAPENQYLMVLARSREALDRTLGWILLGYVLMGLFLGLGITGIVRGSVRRGLDPLDSIARTTAAIDPSDLTFRFATEDLPAEMIPIAKRLNELLGRLQVSFERERRFNADVAHELRTPIAELRTLAELCLRSPRGNGAIPNTEEYFGDVLDIAKKMETLITTLLSLVRCETNRQTVNWEEVDLVPLVKEVGQRFEKESSSRSLSIEAHLPEQAFLRTDRTLISAVLSNLYSNAVSYADAGGTVEVTVRNGPSGTFEFSIRNTQSNLLEEDLRHVFEPFWQKDQSRSDESHSGLGLRLVEAYAGVLGLGVEASLPHSDLFEVRISARNVVPGDTSDPV